MYNMNVKYIESKLSKSKRFKTGTRMFLWAAPTKYFSTSWRTDGTTDIGTCWVEQLRKHRLFLVSRRELCEILTYFVETKSNFIIIRILYPISSMLKILHVIDTHLGCTVRLLFFCVFINVKSKSKSVGTVRKSSLECQIYFLSFHSHWFSNILKYYI